MLLKMFVYAPVLVDSAVLSPANLLLAKDEYAPNKPTLFAWLMFITSLAFTPSASATWPEVTCNPLIWVSKIDFAQFCALSSALAMRSSDVKPRLRA